MIRHRSVRFALMMVLGGWAPAAAAQDGSAGSVAAAEDVAPLEAAPFVERLRVAGHVHVGFRGRVEFRSGTRDGKAIATPGLGVRLTLPLHRYFAVESLMMLSFWNEAELDRADFGRNKLLDLGAMPKARVPIASGAGEMYLGAPAGLSLGFLSHDIERLLEVRTDVGLGWHVGVLMGLQYEVADGIGLLVEMGWTRHDTTYALEDRFTGQTHDNRMVVQQGAFHTGLTVAL